VLVVLLVMRKSESDKPTTVAKAGSGSGSAEATEAAPKSEPGPTPSGPMPQHAGDIKSRLERIAKGEVDPNEKAPPNVKTTTRPDPRPKSEPKAQPKNDPPQANPPSEGQAPAITCEQGCAAAAKCGVPTPNCVTECKASPKDKVCTDLAVKDCNAAAKCAVKATCGAEPYGTSSCEEAFDCMFTACVAAPTNPRCGCACAQQVAPRQTLALFRVWACLLSCPQDANWNNCIQQRCRGPAQACQAL